MSSPLELELRNILLIQGMVIIRDMPMTPHRQLELARLFGNGVNTAGENLRYIQEHPYIFRVSNDARIGNLNNGQYWHVDGHFFPDDERTAVSIHHIVQATPDGDTLFCSLSRAYDELTDEQKENWKDLYCYIPRMGVAYPLLTKHPVTGKNIIYPNFEDGALVTNETGTDQHQPAVAEAIIKILDRLAYRHKWKNGDTVITDQFAFAHCATFADAANLRILHRTTVPLRYVWWR